MSLIFILKIILYEMGGFLTDLLLLKVCVFCDKQSYDVFINGEDTLFTLSYLVVCFFIWTIVIMIAFFFWWDEQSIGDKVITKINYWSSKVGAVIGPPFASFFGLFISKNFEDEKES